MKKLYFNIEIDASPAQVYKTMINADSYRLWTSSFCEGSYFEGSWSTNDKIQFLSPEGGGMYSEIAKNIPNEYISIRHLGMIKDGIIDTESNDVKGWANALENYTFKQNGNKTELLIDIDITEEHEEYMNEAWPRALSILKMICES
jgi:hypothetical protein